MSPEVALDRVYAVLESAGFTRVSSESSGFDDLFVWFDSREGIAVLVKRLFTPYVDWRMVKSLVQQARRWSTENMLERVPLKMKGFRMDLTSFNLLLIHRGGILERMIKRHVDMIGLWRVADLTSIICVDIQAGSCIWKRTLAPKKPIRVILERMRSLFPLESS